MLMLGGMNSSQYVVAYGVEACVRETLFENVC